MTGNVTHATSRALWEAMNFNTNQITSAN